MDFSAYVEERTRGFTGRELVFAAIDAWLGDASAPRMLLLRGDPGAGKTAIAGRLWQFNNASQTPPAGTGRLVPEFLAASHFCTTRDRRWYDPGEFTRSIAQQLAQRVPGFAKVVVDTSSDERVRIDAQLHIGSLENSQAIGIVINSLNVSRTPPSEAFNLLVRDPLEVVFAQPAAGRIVLLIDALDEAQKWTEDDATIAKLIGEASYMPAQVRMILTARTNAKVLPPSADVRELSLTTGDPLSEALRDVRTYVLDFTANHPTLVARFARGLSENALADALRDRSKGNFLWTRSVLNMLTRDEDQITPETFDTMPAELDDVYAEDLERIVRGDANWEERFEPVLSSLAVAQEPLTREQLVNFSGIDLIPLSAVLRSLDELLDATVPRNDRTYAVFHRSLAEFLLDMRRTSFVCDIVGRNERIANYYVGEPMANWDEYGLRHTTWHLREAAIARKDPHRRKQDIAQLLTLVLDPAFRQAHEAVAYDIAQLPRALEAAVLLGAADLDAPLQVAEAALTLVGTQVDTGRPQPVFEAARVGHIPAAERRLEMVVNAEPDWRYAALLTIVWTAADVRPADAQMLFDRVLRGAEESQLPRFGALADLRDRVQATLSGTPWPGARPPVPLDPMETAEDIVTRAEGWSNPNSPGPERLPNAVGFEALAPGSDYEQAMWVTVTDASRLVAYAIDAPDAGKHLLRRYLAVLGRNQYMTYRNRYLWSFLSAVLLHPDPAWTRDLVAEVVMVALSGAEVHVHEAVSVALLGDSVNDIDARRMTEQNAFFQRRAEEKDTWGSEKRLLAALAETYTVRVSGGATTAFGLLDMALRLPYGYAGFQAPACLTLAESARICNAPVAQQALDSALAAAHNVQDPAFCLRTTARVNALRERWWQTPIVNLGQVIERFVADPRSAEFSALHHVGETFVFREISPSSVNLPVAVRTASTLEQLATAYQVPLDELRRLNPHPPVDVPLAAGESVNLPDPGLTPLLAAFFAGQALALGGGPRLTQQLVPLATSNMTALDTVLGRLLLACGPLDPVTRQRLKTANDALTPPEKFGRQARFAAHVAVGRTSSDGSA
jgi:hypothetical protein